MGLELLGLSVVLAALAVHPFTTYPASLAIIARLFGSRPGLQQAREVAVVPDPRHTELDCSDPSIPRPLSAPIPVSSSFPGPFIPFRSQMLAHLQVHQLLGKHSHAVSQELRLLQLRVAQQLFQCHP